MHNGVSDQDPEGEQGRRCEVSGVTGDIRKLAKQLNLLVRVLQSWLASMAQKISSKKMK